MKITMSGPQSIGQIATYFKHGSLFLSPEEYQRESAWNLEQKKLLIDTIFRGLDMPKFYLWKVDDKTLHNSYPDGETKNIYKALLEKKRKENDDPEPYVFEVVDGQQRIRTMLEYMGYPPPTGDHYRGAWLSPFEALPDTPLAKGRAYAKLNPEQQNRFEQTSLSVMMLEDANIDEIRDMFLRLQNGTPLNAQQKRDAMGSHAGAQARILTELPFFTTSVAFGNEVGDHRRVASQMLYLESKDRIAPCTSQRLDKFYKEHCNNNTLDGSTMARAKKILEILGKTFPAKCPHINRSYALSLYWAISRILKIYSVLDAELSKIKDNFERLNVARLEAGKRDYSNPDDADLQDLSVSMSHGTDGSEGIETRNDILMQFLFDKVDLQALPTLDPQRDFTHEEKLILYHRAGGLCQLAFQGNACGRPIDFDSAAIDHILPHSKGGRTELTNGRYSARSCNISRGTRDDFDPAKACCLRKDAVPATVSTS
jgi:hypothetical protein